MNHRPECPEVADLCCFGLIQGKYPNRKSVKISNPGWQHISQRDSVTHKEAIAYVWLINRWLCVAYKP